MRLSVQTRVAIATYLLLLAAYLITASGHFYSTDHIQVYETAQSLVDNQSLVIKTQQNAFRGVNGEYYSTYEPGQSFASIPLYTIGIGVDAVSSTSVRAYFSGPNIGAWGGTVPIFFVSLFNQLLTPLLCVVLYLFCLRLGFSIRTSFLTSLAYGLGTMAFVGAHEYFQHPLETLCLLATIYVLYSRRNALGLKHALLSGSLFGLGLLTRLNVIVILPLLIGYLAWLRIPLVEPPQAPGNSASPVLARVSAQLWSYGRRLWPAEWRYFAVFIVPSIVAFAIILSFNEVRSGDWLVFHGGAKEAKLSLANLPAGLYGFFFSIGRSVFLYSPPIIAGAFVFRRFLKEHTAEAVLFVAMAAAYLFLYGSYASWHGAGCWGPRYLEPVVPLFVIPAGYLFERKWSSIALGILTIFGAFIALFGTVVNPVYAEQWRGFWDPAQGNAYLYVPNISPIVIHFQDFFAGRNWDLWLQWVLHQNGTGVFLLTLSVPALLLLAAGLILMTCRPKTDPVLSESPPG